MADFAKYRKQLEPYKDVLVFMLCLLGAHFFWKLTVTADEHGGGPVLWFGMNISLPFDYMARHVAKAVYWLVGLTRDTLQYYPPDVLRFDSGSSERIVWGCTALKQSFIWLVIMLFARGQWQRKLWFIPLGWVCIYLFNILRIYIITLVIEQHPEMFGILHNHILKYLFYGMMFLLWVWWTERIAKPKAGKASDPANA